MLQELRAYWLPLMLYLLTLMIAGMLLILTAITPYLANRIPFSHGLIELFAKDLTVRHTSIFVAFGLLANAFVFFKPDPSVLTKKTSSKKPPHDTMAGA